MTDTSPILLHRQDSPVCQGSLLQFPENPIACMRRLHRECGDLAVLEDEGQRLVFVFSPELNHQVLSDADTFHSRFFAVRGSRNSSQRRVTAGLLSQNGPEHRDTRRLLKDMFSKRVLPGYHSTIIRLTEELMSDWKTLDVLDLNSEMVQFMVRMTSALLFGLDDSQVTSQLGHLIDQWVHKNHDVGMGALVSSPQFSGKYDELLEMADRLESSIQEMFRLHRSQDQTAPNVLNLLFQAQASQQQLTDEKLTGHATLLFAAAHLTTAHTFSWTLFLLAQHPNVMRKLQQELSQGIASDLPTAQEIERLPYLDAVIRESMRVMPASSYSQRIVASPVVLGGLNLTPGTVVIFSQYITHHRSDLYENPDQFIPERWETITPSPYEYLPFGAGPRMCIGAPLAMAELRTAMAVMLRRFHFRMASNCTVNGQVISTMLAPTTVMPAILVSPKEIPETSPVYGTIHDLVQLPPEATPRSVRRAA
ncbi:MAG: cytochrome P450 [Planctomyces sp.]|jgi:cytochrome P450